MIFKGKLAWRRKAFSAWVKFINKSTNWETLWLKDFYELKVAKDGQFMFNLKAANGQVILTSELYKTKASAENGIASVQKNGVDAKNFEYRVAKNDKPYFILKAANHQEIGRSQYYSSQAAAEKGVESVINNASSAVIKEVTE